MAKDFKAFFNCLYQIGEIREFKIDKVIFCKRYFLKQSFFIYFSNIDLKDFYKF